MKIQNVVGAMDLGHHDRVALRPRRFARVLLAGLFCVLLSTVAYADSPEKENPPLKDAKRTDLLPPSPGNARNSEGSFVHLKDGRILFAYSRFSGSDSGDFGHATIAGRFSSDGGRTWTSDDVQLVGAEGKMNVMSVSLLRLRDGRIAMFYGKKNSASDLHFLVRFSSDETATWSAPILCTAGDGYFVMNNDRAVQLRSGRILLPVSLHTSKDGKFMPRGVVMTFYSDDNGATWKRSSSTLELPDPNPNGLQEPGVVELKSGKVMMFIRTAMGSQYQSYSTDGGDTWTGPAPSVIAGPLGPASIKRIPSTGDLLLVWNDHSAIDSEFRAVGHSTGKRTPASVAISKDDGRTWAHVHNLLSDPDGWYSYFAIDFEGDNTLVAFCSTGKGQPKLSNTDLFFFKTKNLYDGGRKLSGKSR